MILLTPELHAVLRVNAAAHRDAMQTGTHEPDPAPVVKFFNPLGAATWLATELYDDGDTPFGLADLGFGCPELGCFSLSELAGIRLSFGLRIERDIGFSTTPACRSGPIPRAEPVRSAKPNPSSGASSPSRFPRFRPIPSKGTADDPRRVPPQALPGRSTTPATGPDAAKPRIPWRRDRHSQGVDP